jgi:hypothetical protein
MTVRLAEQGVELIEAPRPRCRCRECGRIWAPRRHLRAGWWLCPAGCNGPGRLAV